MVRSAPYHGSEPVETTCCQQQQAPASSWMTWMENCVTGGDILCPIGCDGNCTRSARADARHKQPASELVLNTTGLDYEGLHDEFLESLLFEQSQIGSSKDDDSSRNSGSMGYMDQSSVSISGSLDSSIVSSSGAEGEGSEAELVIPTQIKARKRPRPVKLPRKRTPPRVRAKVAPAPLPPRKQDSSASASNNNNNNMTVNIQELSKESFPHPITYLHPQCRIQKDKGKGEPIGSAICAKGPEGTLDKLRAKMQLLTEVAFGDSKTPATMKRRKAKISDRTEGYTETRSLIELRMGFLSMTYGVLLRWDNSKAGRVTLVCLRKMCHDSFYPSSRRILYSPTSSNNNSVSIFGKAESEHVPLLDPPFLIAQPEDFEPTQLHISVLYATGLSRRSNWTAQLTFEDSIENILLTWDSDLGYLVPKLGSPLQAVPGTPDLARSCLEIKLFEHRLRRRNQRRLVSSMKVPLSNLRPQPSTDGKPSRMKIPCQDEHDASISIDLLYRSDYYHWRAKELEARRQAEKTFWHKRPVSYHVVEEEEIDEARDPWECICWVC